MTELASRKKRFTDFLFKTQQGVLLLVLSALVIFLSVATKDFATSANLFNILRQVSLSGIMAAGATIILIAGGIDFSLGHVATLAGIVIAGMYKAGFGIAASVVCALIMGLTIGLLNGVLISVLKMPGFIATLAVSTIISGGIFAYTLGYPIYPGYPKGFLFIGQGYVGPIPMPVIIMLAVIAICYVFLNHVKFGRYLFAFGGNRDAARVSGINVRVVEISSYVICAFLSSVAGVVLSARVAGGLPTAGGMPLALDAFTAAILGGTSLNGGKGSILGTLIGVVLIGVINNGLVLYGVPYNVQEIVRGVVILIAIAWNSLQSMRASH